MSRRFGAILPLLVIMIGVLFVAVLIPACGGSGEEEGTPTGTAAATGTSAATGTARASATAAATAASEAPGITDTEILLGVDAPLAGVSGAVYSQMPKATEAYFKYINETQGGVCGRKITYIMEDNQNDPAYGLEAVRKLVEKEKVFAVVGSLADDPHAASWEYLNENKVPDLLVSAGAERFGIDPVGHPWTFQMIPSYVTEGFFYGKYISENLPGAKVGVLYESGPAGHDGLKGVKEGLDPSKNQIVSEQMFELTALSVRSEVTNLKQAGSDVVIIFTDPGFSSQAIKEAVRLGWHPQWVLSYVNSDEMMYQFAPPEDVKGAITFQAFKLANMKDDPAIAEHWEIMKDYGGPQPSNFSVYAQLLGEVAVEIFNRSCDNLTREGVREATESIHEWHSPLLLDGVNVNFSKTDHVALQNGRMLRSIVENGKGKWEYFGPSVSFEGQAGAGGGQ
jgi:ABC-type branched-subunit amino acid transport system substrate-binding protein